MVRFGAIFIRWLAVVCLVLGVSVPVSPAYAEESASPSASSSASSESGEDSGDSGGGAPDINSSTKYAMTPEELEAFKQKVGYQGYQSWEAIPEERRQAALTGYNWLIANKHKAQTGVANMSNVGTESMFNHLASEFGGNGCGFYQWTGCDTLTVPVKAMGKDPFDPAVQMEFWYSDEYNTFDPFASKDFRDNTANYCRHAEAFFSCEEVNDDTKKPKSIEEWTQMEDGLLATFYFMAIWERPSAKYPHATYDRLILYHILWEHLAASGGDVSSDSPDSDSGSSDSSSDSSSSSGGLLAEEDLPGMPKKYEWGEISIEEADSSMLSLEENYRLGTLKDTNAVEEYSSADTFGTAVVFFGILLIVFGLVILIAGIAERSDSITGIPWVKIFTLGKLRYVETSSREERKSLDKGEVSFSGVMVASGIAVTGGLILVSTLWLGILSYVYTNYLA